MNKKPTEQEIIFARYTCDSELVFRIQKELKKQSQESK